MQGVYGAFIGVFLIGLREGLEATLIVSIAAAFLKRNGQSTRAMFAGVALAVLICIGVGVGLNLMSASLPQATMVGRWSHPARSTRSCRR